VVLALALALSLVACSRSAKQANPSPTASGPGSPGSSGPSALPPIPASSGQSLGPNQPPIVWVGGRITELTANHLELKEAYGSVLTLRRLGGSATLFFRISGGRWGRVDRSDEVMVGTKACVETLMDRQNLLALRVFLGADCGPAA
jgi:hypothetical protein